MKSPGQDKNLGGDCQVSREQRAYESGGMGGWIVSVVKRKLCEGVETGGKEGS